MKIIILIFLIAILTIPIILVYWERDKFNGGKCKKCGADLRYEYTYDDGGRKWKCIWCGNSIVINTIDENKFIKK